MKYQPIRYERERSYPMPVAEAWRLLADTDHLNRAIGLPSVEFSARREAGRQLVEAYYQQVLTAGFLHADPHPGNLMWWDDTIYRLDLGMVGEVDAGMRESLLLLLVAFWREDTPVLAEAMLGLATGPPPPDFDPGAFQDELAGLVATYRHVSLKELRLGPLLQQLTEISVRHRVRLPSSLALIGKAFGQMQLAAAELDPSLDPSPWPEPSTCGSWPIRCAPPRIPRTCSTRARNSASVPPSSRGSNEPSECAAAPGFRLISGGPGTSRPRSGSPGAALLSAWPLPPRSSAPQSRRVQRTRQPGRPPSSGPRRRC